MMPIPPTLLTQFLTLSKTKKILLWGFFSLFIYTSCSQKKSIQTADCMVISPKIYGNNDTQFISYTAMIIDKGVIVELGDSIDLKNKYSCSEIIRYSEPIFPAFIDAHCHFWGLALNEIQVDLTGCKSWNEVLERCKAYHNQYPNEWIIGRGWDESLWENPTIPTNESLNKLFPNTPLFIRRVDGHAGIANNAALNIAGIHSKTQVKGGEIRLSLSGEVTGLLIDNAMELVRKHISEPSKNQLIEGLKKAGKICNSYGLITLADAGLDPHQIELIDSLIGTGDIQFRLYAMLNNNPVSWSYAREKGAIKTLDLRVHGFKFFADGALGSAGAKLKTPYCLQHKHNGLLLTEPDSLIAAYKLLFNMNFQAHTHCIGDSANFMVLSMYNQVLQNTPNKRWRIEHAQVLDTADFKLFGYQYIIPSIQPIHATSDMRWAEKQLCSHRLPGAYAYQSLLNQTGIVAIGTDFPIESPHTFANFYAAVARQNLENMPENGFLPAQKLTRTQTLLGMTNQAAYSLFMENITGSLKPGLQADYMVLTNDILTCETKTIPQTHCKHLFKNGKKIF